jgi:hypothetical protein
MALIGYEDRKRRLDQTIAEIRSQLGHRGTGDRRANVPQTEQSTRRKRVLSPAARKRIAAAQKKRWAAFKQQKGEEDKPELERKPDQQSPRRTMSAAARKRIGDATRKRWAARRKPASFL